MAADAQTPGRPRDASIDQCILTTLLDLVNEVGLGAVTVDAIAERAGVSKATIYRRWESKEAMLVDGLVNLASNTPLRDGEDVRSGLIKLLDDASDFLDSRAGSALPWLVGEVTAGTPLGKRYAESVVWPRRKMVADLIGHGVETGRLHPDLDVELATDLVGGLVLMKKLRARYQEFPDDWVASVVDMLLEGWSAE